jgi:hypothetical protein
MPVGVLDVALNGYVHLEQLPVIGTRPEPLVLSGVDCCVIILIVSVPMPKNSNKPWTADDDKRLLELKAAGTSHGAMGVALGRSTGSIMARLSVLNTKTARLKRSAASIEASLEALQKEDQLRPIAARGSLSA